MKLKACVVFLLLTCCVRLQIVDCHLPDFTPAPPRLQVEVSESDVVTSLKKNQKNGLSRLPGLCRRLKRRRITVLCNRENFCWRGRSQRTGSVQVCLCPRGSRCSHFFLHSL
ncbi:uncharacterized protein si:ch211-191i18.4 [Sebastes umbrosus]|uniref:uncharacterized protein si:ch211-191i18.4 n=1 Tax=Sebastes umbrosus TaxID=72105 RepID=UPI00189E4730|nr:uncharacterized protein si:ch211-191i18.4 [Sebastes umbrosus]